ncbi:30S ribosomal protein THX [Arenibacter nanhaiticus]|nr:30S ribosomal protein THX [Arenibacter nanhaiticus]
MGKGDKKSKRGKIINKTYGTRRKRKLKRKPSIEEKISVGKKK